MAQVINGFPFDSKHFDAEGPHPLIRIRDLNATRTETNYTGEWVAAAEVNTGDVLVGMDGDFNAGVWRGGKALLNQRMCCVRGNSALVTRFLHYVLPTPLKITNDLTYSTTVKHLSSLDVERITLAVPPDGELERVVNFLDEQTARIDALIAEKERLLAALDEWHAAELERICLGRGRPARRVDNAWIDGLPEGWQLTRLKFLIAGIEQGWSPECEARLAADDEWGVLKAGASNRGVYRDDEHKALPQSVEPVTSLEVRPGDVLVSRASGSADLVGSFAFVYATRPRLMLSDKNFRLKFSKHPELAPELLAWACNTHTLREQILQFVSGAEGLAKNIGSSDLRELWLAVPPRSLQPDLIRAVREMREKVGQLQRHVETHVARLREYRSSLISAAVTGQLRIGDFADSIC